MPTISLRLTDEEHAALKEWAHGSRRSMQREAVFRIFSELSERDASDGAEVKNPVLDGRASDRRVPTPTPALPRSENSDDHFKPDFKK